MIPVSKPSIGKEELGAINKVFQTGWLGLGSVVCEFENGIKDYLQAKNVIAVNTGTSALHIALDSLGVGVGDEVIVPSLTFAATVQAITQRGATPIFCEIRENDLNISTDSVSKLITSKTKAVVPVHYCGKACDMDVLLELGVKYAFKVIEDAAHAFGSGYKRKKIGSFGDITCFSFDPIKNITCGEGGALTLANDVIAEKIRRKRILGINKDTWHRYQNKRSWFYEVVEQGYRYHLNNISAAIGLEQLKKIEMFIRRKREITIQYDQIFKHLNDIITLDNDYQDTAQFCYIIRVLNRKRDKLMEYLKSKGIESGVHYIPNHLQPYFRKFTKSLPVTEMIGEQILTLPLFPEMTDREVDLVSNSVKEFANGA